MTHATRRFAAHTAAPLVAFILGGCALAGPASERPRATPAAAAPTPAEAGLTVVTRGNWGAADPVLPLQPHEPARITIHHTATPQRRDVSIEDKLRALQRFSQRPDSLASGQKKPAWPDVPYHYYIDVGGRVAEGRDVRFVGDSNTPYDPTGHLLIVLEGNFEEERPSPEQMATLRRMVGWAAARWRVPAAEIKGHKDYAATACPGLNLYAELEGLRSLVARMR